MSLRKFSYVWVMDGEQCQIISSWTNYYHQKMLHFVSVCGMWWRHMLHQLWPRLVFFNCESPPVRFLLVLCKVGLYVFSTFLSKRMYSDQYCIYWWLVDKCFWGDGILGLINEVHRWSLWQTSIFVVWIVSAVLGKGRVSIWGCPPYCQPQDWWWLYQGPYPQIHLLFQLAAH